MNKYIIVLILLCQSLLASAQSSATAPSLLSEIASNNTQLKAAREANRALIADAQAENRLGATSVEYSPFSQSGVSGISSSELIISQEFDFPTLYATRSRSVKAQNKVFDLQYATLRRDILLEAQQLCYDLMTARQTHTLLQSRIAAADSLLHAFELRLNQGDATLIDLNRIKMDRMAVCAEVIRNDAETVTILNALKRLNGGLAINESLLSTVPSYNEDLSLDDAQAAALTAMSSRNLDLATAEAALHSSQQELRVAQQGWLPSLTLGYRRNTDLDEAQNGVLLGISLPLFSNTGKVKAARLRRSAAEQEVTDAQIEQEARAVTLSDQTRQLRLLINTYDETLMRQTLRLLQHAVMAGELSVIDYYTEADRIYTMLQERLSTVNEYNKKMAEIYRDHL